MSIIAESISDIFKNMDEVRAYVEKFKTLLSPNDYEWMLFLFGLRENNKEYETVQIQGKEVKIDKYLVPIVEDLNNRNIPTLASCSGLKSEHPADEFAPTSGYLTVSFSEDLLAYLEAAVNDPVIEVKTGECYFQPGIAITIKCSNDEAMKEKWALIWDVFKNFEAPEK